MDGERALKYVRSRNAEGEEGTDFARARRQQVFLAALKSRLVATETLFSPNRIGEMAEIYQDYVLTDIKTEEYLAFSGEIENPAPQEVIFADAANFVHARRWTFRQSRRSTVSPQTARVLVVSEGLHDTAPVDVSALIDQLGKNIATAWTAPRQQAILTAGTPRLEIS